MTIKRTFLVAVFTWLTIVLLIGQAQAQTPVHTHNGNDLARFRLARITAPAKVTYIEPTDLGLKVEYVSWDRVELENGSFIVPKKDHNDEVKKGGWYFISYCEADRHVYGVYKLTLLQMKGIPTSTN